VIGASRPTRDVRAASSAEGSRRLAPARLSIEAMTEIAASRSMPAPLSAKSSAATRCETSCAQPIAIHPTARRDGDKPSAASRRRPSVAVRSVNRMR